MPSPWTRDGFTFIELILVVLIIGIMSIVVLPNWTATSLNLEFEARRVLHDIRYAQSLSMNSGERYRWVKLSSTSYQMTNEAGSAILLPTGGTQVTLAHGASFGSFTNLPNNLIAFNSEGTPYTDSSYPGTALSSEATIPLIAGSQTRSIQITQETGRGTLQ